MEQRSGDQRAGELTRYQSPKRPVELAYRCGGALHWAAALGIVAAIEIEDQVSQSRCGFSAYHYQFEYSATNATMRAKNAMAFATQAAIFALRAIPTASGSATFARARAFSPRSRQKA